MSLFEKKRVRQSFIQVHTFCIESHHSKRSNHCYFQNLLRDLRLPKENTLFLLTPELNHTGGAAAAAADTKNGDR